MNSKTNVALIIIYNHKFDKNIVVLEDIYKARFSNIYHLVPFYNGTKDNVIPVYENSFYFQGYVAQGLKFFFREQYQHYFFVADDLVINPVINESNYRHYLSLGPKTCFIPEFITLHESNKGKERWERIVEAFHFKLNNVYGVEVKNECPDYATALNAFKSHGLSIHPLHYNQITTPQIKPRGMNWHQLLEYGKWKLRVYKNRHKLYNLNYPILGSYSDIFVVSADSINQFAHYCGVFATNRLFVEFAIPTAIVLSAKEIVVEKNLILQGKPIWPWEDFSFLDKYDKSIPRLLADFPNGLLYLHPIKLSQWHL